MLYELIHPETVKKSNCLFRGHWIQIWCFLKWAIWKKIKFKMAAIFLQFNIALHRRPISNHWKHECGNLTIHICLALKLLVQKEFHFAMFLTHENSVYIYLELYKHHYNFHLITILRIYAFISYTYELTAKKWSIQLICL